MSRMYNSSGIRFFHTSDLHNLRPAASELVAAVSASPIKAIVKRHRTFIQVCEHAVSALHEQVYMREIPCTCSFDNASKDALHFQVQTTH